MSPHSQASRGRLQLDPLNSTRVPIAPRGSQDETYRTWEGTKKPQGSGHIRQGRKQSGPGATWHQSHKGSGQAAHQAVWVHWRQRILRKARRKSWLKMV